MLPADTESFDFGVDSLVFSEILLLDLLRISKEKEAERVDDLGDNSGLKAEDQAFVYPPDNDGSALLKLDRIGAVDGLIHDDTVFTLPTDDPRLHLDVPGPIDHLNNGIHRKQL